MFCFVVVFIYIGRDEEEDSDGGRLYGEECDVDGFFVN